MFAFTLSMIPHYDVLRLFLKVSRVALATSIHELLGKLTLEKCASHNAQYLYIISQKKPMCSYVPEIVKVAGRLHH